MLGDAGSNGLGALLGVGIVLGSTHGFRLLALLLLAITTFAGARPGLSRLIDSVPILRRFDRAGRVESLS